MLGNFTNLDPVLSLKKKISNVFCYSTDKKNGKKKIRNINFHFIPPFGLRDIKKCIFNFNVRDNGLFSLKKNRPGSDPCIFVRF